MFSMLSTRRTSVDSFDRGREDKVLTNSVWTKGVIILFQVVSGSVGSSRNTLQNTCLPACIYRVVLIGK